MLMKLTPVINFVNVKRANFSYKCSFSSFYYIHVTRKKLPKQRTYEKFVRKMLMKLTPEYPSKLIGGLLNHPNLNEFFSLVNLM